MAPQIGPLSHSFISCEDPATFDPRVYDIDGTPFPAYGKQPRPYDRDPQTGNCIRDSLGRCGSQGSEFEGPGYVEYEPGDTRMANCNKKMVCPSVKKRMCKTGPTNDPYWLPGYLLPGKGTNCHDWARCLSD